MADRGATDPLSEPTRLAKRNLLGLSLAALTLRIFHQPATTVEIPGLKGLSPEAVAFSLLAMICYFLASFVIYCFLDIKNRGRTPHEAELLAHADALYSVERNLFKQQLEEYMARRIKALMDLYDPDATHKIWKSLAKDTEPKLTDDLIIDVENNIPHATDKLAYRVLIEINYAMTKFVADAAKLKGDEGATLEAIRKHISNYARDTRGDKEKYLYRYIAWRLIYYFRVYIWDIAMPLCLAFAAVYALYVDVDVSTLKQYLPKFGPAPPVKP